MSGWKLNNLGKSKPDEEWVTRCATKTTIARKRTHDLQIEAVEELLSDIKKKDQDVLMMETERDAAYVGIAMELLDLVNNGFVDASKVAGGDKSSTMKITALASIMKKLFDNVEDFKRM